MVPEHPVVAQAQLCAPALGFGKGSCSFPCFPLPLNPSPCPHTPSASISHLWELRLYLSQPLTEKRIQMLWLKAAAHKQAFLLGSTSCHQPKSSLMHQLGMQQVRVQISATKRRHRGEGCCPGHLPGPLVKFPVFKCLCGWLLMEFLSI